MDAIKEAMIRAEDRGDVTEYRFECRITDANGEEIIADYTSRIGPIDVFGGSESVDHTVARMLRQFKRMAQREYEKAETGVEA